MTVRSCSGCGHRGSADAAYCVRCGLPHTDHDGRAANTAATPPDDRPRRSATWLVLVAVSVAIGLGAWWVVERGAGSGAGSTDGDLTAQPSGATDVVTPSSRTAVVAPSDPPPDEVQLIDLPIGELPRQPKLAALSGHYLVVQHSLGLLRVDVDAGEVERFDNAQRSGELVGRYRDHLLLFESGRMIAVSVDDPTADETLLFDLERPGINAARMIDDHRMVVRTWRFDPRPIPSQERFFIDLRSGEVRQDHDAWQTDDLTWVPGGGLFEFVDGRYRHLADGPALVSSERDVLVRECEQPDECEARWIERATGDATDRHVPADEFFSAEALDPGPRLLFVNYFSRHRYFDTENGWLLPATIVRGTAGNVLDTRPEAVVDGRLLITPTVAGIVIYDLDTHDAFLLEFGVDELRGVTGVVAVPKPNRWEPRS